MPLEKERAMQFGDIRPTPNKGYFGNMTLHNCLMSQYLQDNLSILYSDMK